MAGKPAQSFKASSNQSAGVVSTTTSNVGDKSMETLIIEAATDEDINARILQAADRGEPQPPGYFFDSEETRLDTLNGNRLLVEASAEGQAVGGGCVGRSRIQGHGRSPSFSR
ncbi:hypothetical protein CCR82_09180 [Halochromatium salexigens]|uniref:Uncharacterized protein n=1 Tax=Halochromatium salexigens TaxID=49447 RepID=A0AAJ0XFS6_HALSE|nr:hypothetical protein [Halochromatium salexigens]